MKYRNEWKYVVSEAELSSIENRLDSVLKRDEHSGSDGCYEIHSLYFDDYKNSCVMDNEAGLSRRYKWRIRYYGNDASRMRLERKEKYNGRCLKRSCQLSLEDFDNIVNRNFDALLWKENQDPLIRSLCKDMMNRLFSPRIIVDYVRVAYVDQITNTRITVDKHICASAETDRFLTRDYLQVPVLNTNIHVLEVKFDDILPSYIKQAVFLKSLNQSSFSKYYLSMKKTGGI